MNRKQIRLSAYVVFAAALVVAGVGGEAWALPSFSSNCSGCHTTARAAGAVSGNTGTLNPAGGSGSLKEFDVLPGGIIPLAFNVSNSGGNNYALALLNLGNTGLAGKALAYTPDVAWTNAGSYFYSSVFNGNATRTFNLKVSSSAVPDIYTLRFNVAGGSGVWNQSELFYVRVIPEPATLAGLTFAGLALLRRKRRTR